MIAWHPEITIAAYIVAWNMQRHDVCFDITRNKRAAGLAAPDWRPWPRNDDDKDHIEELEGTYR